MKDQPRVLRGSLRTVHAGVSASETNRVVVIGVTESVARITSFEVYSMWQRGISQGDILSQASPRCLAQTTARTLYFKPATVEVSGALKLEADKLLSCLSKEGNPRCPKSRRRRGSRLFRGKRRQRSLGYFKMRLFMLWQCEDNMYRLINSAALSLFSSQPPTGRRWGRSPSEQ